MLTQGCDGNWPLVTEEDEFVPLKKLRPGDPIQKIAQKDPVLSSLLNHIFKGDAVQTHCFLHFTRSQGVSLYELISGEEVVSDDVLARIKQAVLTRFPEWAPPQ